MTRLLVVDCYLDRVGGARNVAPHLGPCDVVRAAHEPLPGGWAWGGVVLTGSAASVLDGPAWLGPVEGLVAEALARRAPVLGICFGHQVLARVLWGARAVRRAPRPELGWETVERTAPDELLDALPRSFPCFVSHGDEVDPAAVGDGATVLARTPACAVQAFRAAGAPAWGVQFHAEMGLEESEELVRSRAGARAGELLARRVDGGPLAAALLARFRSVVRGRGPGAAG